MEDPEPTGLSPMESEKQGVHPIVVATDQGRGMGTDIILPPVLEDTVLSSPEGRALLAEGRVVVVLQ